jgi:Ras-related protein Rab-1A
LVGNKSDLADQRQVTFSNAKKWADSVNIPILETSAKNSSNVEQAFLTMARQIKEKMGSLGQDTSNNNFNKIRVTRGASVQSPNAANNQAGGGCC